jgi:hypothetical protein
VLSSGGDHSDFGYDIEVDSSGSLLMSGSFYSDVVDLDPGPEVDERYNNGVRTGFLIKYKP